jgi:membrane protease YdiL (CAAX protease family)
VVAHGGGPAHWGLFPDTFTWDFMLYIAVGSFLGVPVEEELAARGSMQTRLAEDFGPAGAIFITAFFFAIGQSQYFKLEILSIGLLVSLVISSVISKAPSLFPRRRQGLKGDAKEVH